MTDRRFIAYTLRTMKNDELFNQLRKVFGNHTRAAKKIGINARTYRGWRSNGIPRLKKAHLVGILNDVPPSNGTSTHDT